MEETLVFDMTEAAASRIRDVAIKESIDPAEQYLRVAVVTGGCSGLTYDLGWDAVLGEHDVVVERAGLRIALDVKSRLYVEGTTLDFSDGIEGKGFHFENPQATRTCACGESFSL